MIQGLAAGTYAQVETNHGEFVIRLFTAEAPVTTANFIGLAEGTKPWRNPLSGKEEKSRFFDGLVFHRIIDGFMIQGGDPAGNGTGGPGYTFEDEFASGLRFDRPGLLAMANRGPATNGSQFFITLVPTPHLNNRHTIFGEVVQGMDVINKIGKVPTGPSDRPREDVTLKSVRISTVGKDGQVTEGAPQ